MSGSGLSYCARRQIYTSPSSAKKKKKPRPLLALSVPPDPDFSRHGGHGDAPPPATRAPATPSFLSLSPMWWPRGWPPAAPLDRRASLRHDGGLRLWRSAARVTCRRPSPATAWRQQGSPSRALRWLATRVLSEAGSSKP